MTYSFTKATSKHILKPATKIWGFYFILAFGILIGFRVHLLMQVEDLKEMQNTELFIRGRHDPCIAVRGVPVIEAAAAICILDILMSGGIIR